MSKALLFFAWLHATNLTKANLQETRLVSAQLQGILLIKTDVKKADFTLAEFRGAKFAELINEKEANWLGAKLDDVERAINTDVGEWVCVDKWEAPWSTGMVTSEEKPDIDDQPKVLLRCW